VRTAAGRANIHAGNIRFTGEWSIVHINVRYTPDLRQSVRLNLYLRRKSIWTGVIFGALMIILGVAVIGHVPPELAVILIAIGVVMIPEIPVLVWLQVHRSRGILLSEVEVTLTSEGIERRTDTATIHLTWDKLERIRELNDMWVFVANRLTRFGVAKRVLSRDQQVELAAFIAERAT
jgi:hypothetical protein